MNNSMNHLIKVKTEEIEFFIETDKIEKDRGLPTPAGVPQELVKEIASFDKFSKVVKSICSSLVNNMNEIPIENRPSKYSAEFGMKINLEGNIYLVNVGGEATFTISAEWESR